MFDCFHVPPNLGASLKSSSSCAQTSLESFQSKSPSASDVSAPEKTRRTVMRKVRCVRRGSIKDAR